MERGDVPIVLSLIQSTGTDAFEDAKKSFNKDLVGEQVCEYMGKIIGVAGFHPIEHADRAAMMSWVFLEPNTKLPGGPTSYLRETLAFIHAAGYRKVFVEIGSNDPPLGGTSIRSNPTGIYCELGFIKESEYQDYYAPRDHMTVLGYRLDPLSPSCSNERDERPILIRDYDEMEETDGTYAIEWAFDPDGHGSTLKDFQRMTRKVKRWRGRSIFACIPDDAYAAKQQLTDAGFRPRGTLKDMITDGTDEVRYQYDV